MIMTSDHHILFESQSKAVHSISTIGSAFEYLRRTWANKRTEASDGVRLHRRIPTHDLLLFRKANPRSLPSQLPRSRTIATTTSNKCGTITASPGVGFSISAIGSPQGRTTRMPVSLETYSQGPIVRMPSGDSSNPAGSSKTSQHKPSLPQLDKSRYNDINTPAVVPAAATEVLGGTS